MARIAPFKGILYNTNTIKLAEVVAPPFDVISKEEQENFHRCHPNNMTWLTLGKTTKDDTNSNNPYTRAADYLNTWLSKNILIQDVTTSYYLTSHTFPFEGKPIARYGLICLVGLEPFEKGIVLPHEKTFSKIKSQRLELIKACKSNLSAIFSLYSDHENRILDKLKGAVLEKSADIDFTDNNNHEHRLWRITDNGVHRYVSEAFKDKTIFIADGHHRYETALKYKEWLTENSPDFNSDHPANYVMMYLCSMEDPGLIILPAHRMLNEVPEPLRASLISNAPQYFDVTTFPFEKTGKEQAKKDFISALKSKSSLNCIGVFMKDRSELCLLTLKSGVMEQKFGDELPESLKNIDVTVLTRLIFMELLGFDQARLDNERLIAYSSIADDAIEAVAAGKHDIAFIINPTRIEQVRSIAENGLIMPRKATYFYPKVITGQVMNSVSKVWSA
ncbi:MAG: DUF1015 domain-containing protein [Deltaproteobacteria bacterium]|nr:DUF1015 domain-containing protein [Deltaproteobacteria bacterium]